MMTTGYRCLGSKPHSVLPPAATSLAVVQNSNHTCKNTCLLYVLYVNLWATWLEIALSAQAKASMARA